MFRPYILNIIRWNTGTEGKVLQPDVGQYVWPKCVADIKGILYRVYVLCLCGPYLLVTTNVTGWFCPSTRSIRYLFTTQKLNAVKTSLSSEDLTALTRKFMYIIH
jgi:hypothetical protein